MLFLRRIISFFFDSIIIGSLVILSMIAGLKHLTLSSELYLLFSFVGIAYFMMYDLFFKGNTIGRKIVNISVIYGCQNKNILRHAFIRYSVMFLWLPTLRLVVELFAYVFLGISSWAHYQHYLFFSLYLIIPISSIFSKGSYGINDLASKTRVCYSDKKDKKNVATDKEKILLLTRGVISALIISIILSSTIQPYVHKFKNIYSNKDLIDIYEQCWLSTTDYIKAAPNTSLYLDGESLNMEVYEKLKNINYFEFSRSTKIMYEGFEELINDLPCIRYYIPVTLYGLFDYNFEVLTYELISRKIHQLPIIAMLEFTHQNNYGYLTYAITKKRILIQDNINNSYIILDPDMVNSVSLTFGTAPP